ncbi:MAG: AraC family ligand binding domain-containing protein, partial [Hyphomonadaceae bacterium]|nr:AraC family ligand binding domain-containing protein [Clostridia bacterium]
DETMHIDLPLIDLGYADLSVVVAGKQDCPPSHSHGPAVRDYYLIHYILKGRGTYTCKGKSYAVGANQGFLICPHDITYYEADGKDPWQYIWVGFRGLRAIELLEQIGLGQKNPVFYSDACKPIFEMILKALDISYGRELYMMSVLFTFFSILSKKDMCMPKSYANQAAGYINANIGMVLKVGNIAKMLGLDRRYFCQVFKQEYGSSPQQYIIEARMESAKSLLLKTSLSVADIARSVGYPDQLGFSKIFKQHFGVSPIGFRKGI